MTSSKTTTARAISIIGHPLVLLSASAFILALARGAPPLRLALIGVVAGVGVLLIAWARGNVRKGKWTHVDASHPAERRQWDVVLLACLLAISALGFVVDRQLAVALLPIAAVIAASLLFSRWLKLSQHVAFAVLAAFIAGAASSYAGAIIALIAVVVAWSRLVLQRHTVREVIAGAIIGAAAGSAFALLVG